MLVAVLAVASVIAAAQTEADQTEIRRVISDFENALQTRSIEKIENLVSPDLVVFENDYRNDGWPDFRDRPLAPQFKASPTQYRSEIVKVDVSPSMAWGYFRMSRNIIHDGDKRTGCVGGLRSEERSKQMENCRTQLECKTTRRIACETTQRNNLISSVPMQMQSQARI